nr:MAG TPA: hypothetical protein [Caudoviricetes sp.]
MSTVLSLFLITFFLTFLRKKYILIKKKGGRRYA